MTSEKSTGRIAMHCRCGVTAHATIRPESQLARFKAWWKRMHQGPKCGPATADEARRARKGQQSYKPS